ncbi:MAG: YihY family inner membrane protein [Holophagae bacterium]
MHLREDLTRLDVSDLPPWRRGAVRLAQFVILLWDQLRRDKLIIRASGLAYASLLATVPLIAVVFALLSAFGALDDLKQRVQDVLFSYFLPAQHAEIAAMLDTFTMNAAKLGFFGFAFLLVAAVLVLDSVESNFNDIYHVASRRRLISKITSYTAVLVIGTLFIGASISISARVESMLVRGVPIDLSWLTLQTAWLFPLILVFLAFLLAFTVVPFTRVRVKSAVLGAASSAVLFELAKNLFANSVGQSVRYSAIYGGLAVVPIFLIWLYVTWIVVLIGLEIAFTHQHFLTLLRSRVAGNGSEDDAVAMGLRLFGLVVQRYDAGDEPPTSDQLSRRLLVPVRTVQARIQTMVDAGLLRQVALGPDTEGVVPAQPSDRVTVWDVAEVFQPRRYDLREDQWVEHAVASVLDDFVAAGRREIGDMTFRSLLAGDDGRPGD